MKYSIKRTIIIVAVALFVFMLPASGLFAAGEGEGTSNGEVELLYVEWADAIATTYVAQVVLEEMGYDVELVSVSAAAMWEGIASGDGDGMLAAWLPGTHGDYLSETEDDLDLLGPVLEGARIGLMVPTYVDIDSLEELNEHADEFGNEIVGIDPGAGLMQASEQALTDYSLDDMELLEGSDATMTATLDGAYQDEEWIVVTGWTPHWKEAAYDLKYLEDPNGTFGGEEAVHAVAREGLAEDMPDVHAFLSNFNWSVDELGEILMWNEEDGADPYETAERWVSENRAIVDAWIPQ